MLQEPSGPKSNQNGFLDALLLSKQVPPATFKRTIFFYIFCSILMLSLSIATFVIFSDIDEQKILYYEPSATNNCLLGQKCSYQLQIKEVMQAPIYVLYQLEGFYQNHRRYIQSKSNYQLAGMLFISEGNVLSNYHEAAICEPFVTNQQVGVTHSWGGHQLDPKSIASPCGAIAKTFFNDSFSLYAGSSGSINTSIIIEETGISWPGDKGKKYKRSGDSEKVQWINPENEHFIVWMRTSGLPNFKKIWGKIQTDLTPGNYTLVVNNNFNSTKWQGNRYLILTENSPFGGKNYTISIVLFVLGVSCAVVSIVFCLRWKQAKQKST